MVCRYGENTRYARLHLPAEGAENVYYLNGERTLTLYHAFDII